MSVLQKHCKELISQKESEHLQLQTAIKHYSRGVKTALKDCSRVFSELKDHVERCRLQVKEVIRAQEEAELTRARNQLQRLQEEICDLRSSQASEEEQGADLQSSFSSLVLEPHVSFSCVRTSVLDLKQRLEEVFVQELPTVTKAVTSVSLLHMESPKRGADSVVLETRENLLHYLLPLTFDPFSAHPSLSLTEGSRVVVRSERLNPYPEHEERFDCWTQVLSHQGVRSRGFWECEWEGPQAAVGVCYHSMDRKGSSDSSRLGYNSSSWCLKFSGSSLSFCGSSREQQGAAGSSREQQVVVADSSRSSRVALYLDPDCGQLCFYTVTSRGLHLLHRLQHRFTEPLHAAVWVGSGSSVRICH